MRTIKFRGKAAGSGRWIYGYLASEDLITDDKDEYKAPCWVIPETVGQFTGLYDRTGKEIYEGDIVKIDFLNRNSAIEYNKDAFMASTNSELSYYVYEIRQSCRIIGNIHDTPELLKRR